MSNQSEERMNKLLGYPHDVFLMLRLEFVWICQDELEAKILRIIEKTVETERKKLYQEAINKHGVPAPDEVLEVAKDIWVPISYRLFLNDLFGTVTSENTLKRAIKSLIDKKIIFRRHDQKQRYDAPEYKIHINVLQMLLDVVGKPGSQKLIPSIIDALKSLPPQELTPSECQKLIPSTTSRVSKIDPNITKVTDNITDNNNECVLPAQSETPASVHSADANAPHTHASSSSSSSSEQEQEPEHYEEGLSVQPSYSHHEHETTNDEEERESHDSRDTALLPSRPDMPAGSTGISVAHDTGVGEPLLLVPPTTQAVVTVVVPIAHTTTQASTPPEPEPEPEPVVVAHVPVQASGLQDASLSVQVAMPVIYATQDEYDMAFKAFMGSLRAQWELLPKATRPTWGVYQKTPIAQWKAMHSKQKPPMEVLEPKCDVRELRRRINTARGYQLEARGDVIQENISTKTWANLHTLQEYEVVMEYLTTKDPFWKKPENRCRIGGVALLKETSRVLAKVRELAERKQAFVSASPTTLPPMFVVQEDEAPRFVSLRSARGGGR